MCSSLYVSAQETTPKLYFVGNVPPTVVSRLADDGYKLTAQHRFISWNNGDTHYFVVVFDRFRNCALADFNEEKNNYKIVDSYDRCKYVSTPKIRDLFGDGSQAVVLKFRVHSNSAVDVDVNQTSAYLYVRASNEFCKNDDAGTFAAGFRVSNSVIKFGPSTCY